MRIRSKIATQSSNHPTKLPLTSENYHITTHKNPIFSREISVINCCSRNSFSQLINSHNKVLFFFVVGGMAGGRKEVAWNTIKLFCVLRVSESGCGWMFTFTHHNGTTLSKACLLHLLFDVRLRCDGKTLKCNIRARRTERIFWRVIN